MLRGSLESRDKDVEELSTEISRHLDRYDDLWFVHETLLEELRSEIIALRSGVLVERAGGWLRGKNRNPEGPSSWPGGSGRQTERSTNHVESSGS